MKKQESNLWLPEDIRAEKALTLSSLWGSNTNTYDSWGKQKKPDRAKLLNEYRGVAYACANLNAQGVTKTPLRLYRKSAKGAKCRWPTRSLSLGETKSLSARNKLRVADSETVQELTTHPLLTLLDNPNDSMDCVGLLEISQLFQEIVGIAYWLIVRNALGTPAKIMLLLPQHVKAITDDNGQLVGYEYGTGANKTTYSVDDVIPFKMPNPSSPWLEGFSPIEAVYESIEIENKYCATEAAILDNEGLPRGVLSGKDGIADASRLEKRFNAKFRQNAGGVMVLEDEGIDFKPLSFSPRDLARLSVHENARVAIANAYGVPFGLIDTASSSQYNVDVTIRARHVEDAIVPRLRRLQSVLNRRLVSAFDSSLFVAFDDPSPTNRELTLSEDTQLVSAGILTPNEIRNKRGYEPVDGGDQLAGMYSVGSDTVSSVDSVVDDVVEETVEPVEAEGGTPDDPKPEVTPEANARSALLEMAGGITGSLQIFASLSAGEITRETAIGLLTMFFGISREEAEALVGESGEAKPTPPPEKSSILNADGSPIEMETKAKKKPPKLPKGTRLQKALQKAFKRQAAEVLGSLKSAKGTKALPSKFVLSEDWDRELYEDCQPLVELYFKEAYEGKAKELVARAGLSPDVFNVTNPKLAEKVKKLALEFCKETNACTTAELNAALSDLRDSLEEGLTAGERMHQLTARVQGVFDRAEKERAALIAQTEASRSHVSANVAAAKDSGVVTGAKVLLSSAACDLCRSIAAQGEKGLDDVWHTDPEAPAAYRDKPHPPFHPNCMCDLEYVIEGVD